MTKIKVRLFQFNNNKNLLMKLVKFLSDLTILLKYKRISLKIYKKQKFKVDKKLAYKINLNRNILHSSMELYQIELLL